MDCVLDEERCIMGLELPTAERHLKAYQLFKSESAKDPSNYFLMRKCINHGAEISRYAHLSAFLKNNKELLKEIYADCEKKNLCISRYCDDRDEVERSDFAMAWIYIHKQDYDNALGLINRLPSIDNNCLRGSIMAKYLLFKEGFDKKLEYVNWHLRKLALATAKEFFYDMEDKVHVLPPAEALAYMDKVWGVINANEILLMVENCVKIEKPKSEISELVQMAIGQVHREFRSQVMNHPKYIRALKLLDDME